MMFSYRMHSSHPLFLEIQDGCQNAKYSISLEIIYIGSCFQALYIGFLGQRVILLGYHQDWNSFQSRKIQMASKMSTKCLIQHISGNNLYRKLFRLYTQVFLGQRVILCGYHQDWNSFQSRKIQMASKMSTKCSI